MGRVWDREIRIYRAPKGHLLVATPYQYAAWRRLRPVVMARDGWMCQIRGPRCGGRAWTVDHIVPWEDGGAWFDLSNLRAACGPCNFGKARAAPEPVAEYQPSREW